MAVTAISDTKLADSGVQTLIDIERFVPNLTVNASRATNSTITAYLRGVGQNDPLWGFEPGVGVYIDDVYMARPQGGVLEVDENGQLQTATLDLRHDHELESYPNPFRAEVDVNYRHVSLFEQLAPSAMTDGDVLHDLYVQALTTRGEAIAAVLRAIAEAPQGTVLFHCTAGKDRTGLIAALMLATVGVEHALIVED